MRIFLYFIGKPRDARANGLAAGYVERINRFAACEMREIRPERVDLWAKHPAARKVLLDPGGRQMNSVAFADFLARAEREARDLVFVTGGADGLPRGWAERADTLLSLSPMTFSHELARAMIAEQIYRAFAHLRGHPYPR